MLTIPAGVATWEREIMLERQRKGIATAKAAGRDKGRPVSIDAAQIRQLRAESVPPRSRSGAEPTFGEQVRLLATADSGPGPLPSEPLPPSRH